MKKQDFDKLVTSVRQAGRIRRGAAKPSRTVTFDPADVRATRLRLGKSQTEFALMIGVSAATLRNWEQGRRAGGACPGATQGGRCSPAGSCERAERLTLQSRAV